MCVHVCRYPQIPGTVLFQQLWCHKKTAYGRKVHVVSSPQFHYISSDFMFAESNNLFFSWVLWEEGGIDLIKRTLVKSLHVLCKMWESSSISKGEARHNEPYMFHHFQGASLQSSWISLYELSYSFYTDLRQPTDLCYFCLLCRTGTEKNDHSPNPPLNFSSTFQVLKRKPSKLTKKARHPILKLFLQYGEDSGRIPRKVFEFPLKYCLRF